MKTQHINFTEKTLKALPIPTKADGQAVYYDTGSKDGLCLIVTHGGTKTYYFYMKYMGIPKRVKIARFEHTSLQKARERAHNLRDMAIHGTDPAQAREDELKDMTLQQYYEKVYVPQYSVTHKKPKTLVNDNSIFKNYLSVFRNRKMATITHEEIARHHNTIMKNISLYTANRVLALVRHMYNKAYEWGYPKRFENPTNGVKAFKEKSRDRFLSPDELQRFFAVLPEMGDNFKNYVMLSLFLGQRRSNILSMRWTDIDFENGFVRISDTKNGEPINVPLTRQTVELLTQIKSRATSKWLFPSATSASGHFEDPKNSWKRLLKRANIQDLRLHDLRRTLGSYQAITGASLHIIGKSLGHKTSAATQIYARLTTDPVRESMQKATDRMLEYVKPTATYF